MSRCRPFLYLAIAPIAACSNIAATVTDESRSWAFVQSVGGITVDKAVRSDSGGWDLPINADVSGTRTITTKPTSINSGLACRTSAKVEGSSIYITVSTGVIAVLKGPECPSVHLEGIPSGKYTVYYRGPDEAPVKLYIVDLKVNLK